MKIDSPRFGSIEIESDKLIEFPQGLPGFEAITRYTLLHPEGENPNFFILQAVDEPALAFHIADPKRFGFDYQISLTDAQVALLNLTNPADCAVAVMLTKEDASQPLRAHLNAPLIINLATRRGLQHSFAKLDYDVILRG